MSKIIHFFFTAGLLFLCGYLLLVDSIELPSRYGSSSSLLMPPVTYLMATLPLAFAISLILNIVDSDKYKTHCRIIIALGVGLFFFGIVIVAPLQKAI